MSILNCINWRHISFQELESLLQLHLDTDTSVIEAELSPGLTPLCLACKNNREDLVTILLHHGANASKSCSYFRRQALHFACDHSNGNLGLVRKILQANVDVNAQDDDGNTALHLSCIESNQPVAELLLEHGADVNIADIDGETALVRACLSHSHHLLDVLLKAGADPVVNRGQPLEVAVRLSSIEMLKLLIEAGADIQQGSYMALASEMNLIDVMKVLHNYGADVNKTNVLGLSPLQAACCCQFSSPEAVGLLLSWGADVHSFSATRETALHYACATRDLSKMRLLLSYGAYAGSRGSHCVTPLMAALVSLFQCKSAGTIVMQMLRLLLAAGARLRPDGMQTMRSSVALVRSLEPTTRHDMLQLLEHHAHQPNSLQDLCRLSIRKTIKPSKDINVAKLPLPKQIIAFLRYEDIIT